MCRVSAVCSISLLLLHDANSNTAVIKRCFFMDRFFYDKGRKTKGKSLKGIECFAIASQTTSPQDYKTATAPLVVSLTRCLVVWRSLSVANCLVDSLSCSLAQPRSCSLVQPRSLHQNTDNPCWQTLDAHVLLHWDRLLAMCL